MASNHSEPVAGRDVDAPVQAMGPIRPPRRTGLAVDVGVVIVEL
jgi:hypothetical protein